MSYELDAKYIAATVASLAQEKPAGTLLVDEQDLSLWLVGANPGTIIPLGSNTSSPPAPQVIISGTSPSSFHFQFQLITLNNQSAQWALSYFPSNIPDSVTAIGFPDLTLIVTSVNTSGIAIETLNFPEVLSISGNFTPNNSPALVSMDLSRLISVSGYFNPYGNNSLTSISAPVLTTVGAFFPYNNNSLTEISIPALTIVGYFFPQYNPLLTEILLPALTTVGDNFNPYGNNSLTTISAPALTTVGGNFSPTGNPQLLTLNMPSLTQVGSFDLSNNNFTSVDFPVLQSVHGDFSINTTNLPSLTMPELATITGTFHGGGSYPGGNNNLVLESIYFPSLESIGGNFAPYNSTLLTTFSVPVLTTIGGNFDFTQNPVFVSLEFPSLTTVGGSFIPTDNNALATIYMPALTTVGGNFAPNSNISLTTVNIPAIESIGGGISDSGTIQPWTTFNIGNSLKHLGGDVALTGVAFDQTSVDNLLVALAALDGTNGTILYENHTVTITGTSSAPSATGLAAKTTLQNRGCTVTTN